VVRVRLYTKRGPDTGYRFLGFESLHDTLIDLFQGADPRIPRRNPVALAQEWQRLLDTGQVSSRAALARELGVSRAHVTQVLDVLHLPLEELESILALGDPLAGKRAGIHTLRNQSRLRSARNPEIDVPSHSS